MKNMTLTFLAVWFLAFSCSKAFACPTNVQKIKVGEASPCTAWLVSEPTMQKLAKTDEELEKTKKLVQAQEHLQKLSEAEIDFYKQRSSAQQKQLEKAETKNLLITTGAFVLGVVLTGVAAKAAIEATR